MSSGQGSARGARRARSLAFVLALLCSLGIAAPAAAQAAGAHRARPHPITISARVLDDAGAATPRIDQPGGIVAAQHTRTALRSSPGRPDTTPDATSAAFVTQRTRGPPGAMR